MSDADISPAVNADALSLRKPKKKSRVPSPLLKEEFAARFRIFDIIITTLAACWAVAFTLMIQTSPSHFGWLQGVMSSGLLGSLFGLPAYLLVRLGAIIYTLADHTLREEVALTGMRGHEFLWGRLGPHLVRCAIPSMVFSTIPLLSLLTLNGGERELVGAYCTAMFSMFFGVIASLMAYLAFAPRHGGSGLFAFLRPITYGLCFAGSIGVVIVAEDNHHWIAMVSWGVMTLGGCALARAWYRDRAVSTTIDDNTLRSDIIAVSAVSLCGTLALNLFISEFALPGLGALPNLGMHWLQMIAWAGVFLAVLSVVALLAKSLVPRLIAVRDKIDFTDPMLIAWWLLLWSLTLLPKSLHFPRVQTFRRYDVWLALTGGTSASLHMAAVAGLAILLVCSRPGTEGKFIVLRQSFRVLLLYVLALAGAVAVHAAFPVILMVIIYYRIMFNATAPRPMPWRLAAYLLVIFLIANLPVMLNLQQLQQHDDWSLVLPYAAIWPALAVLAWIFAERNYFRQER